jgi:hypothetical protein
MIRWATAGRPSTFFCVLYVLCGDFVLSLGCGYATLPDLESLAKSEKERKLVAVHRTFQLAGLYSLRNSGSLYKKTGDDSPPLMPEELERVIKNLPREPEVVDLFKNLFGAGPLPPR